MSNYVYNDDFLSITGTIDGSDFHSHFNGIETAIATKADLAGPQTLTGTHTFSGTLNVTGAFVGDVDGGTY